MNPVKKMSPGVRRRAILDALAAAGERGITSTELAKETGVSTNITPSALRILEKRGLVRALPKKRKTRGARVKLKVWVLITEDEHEAKEKRATSKVVPIKPKISTHAPEFWESIRTQIRDFRRATNPELMENIDDITYRRLEGEFIIDLREAERSFNGRLRSYASTAKRSREGIESVSRKAIFAACRVLQVEPPAVGKPVDIKAAKRNKHKMARAYHPDASGGVQNEHTRSMYEAVIAAYETVEQYNLSLKGSSNAA